MVRFSFRLRKWTFTGQVMDAVDYPPTIYIRVQYTTVNERATLWQHITSDSVDLHLKPDETDTYIRNGVGDVAFSVKRCCGCLRQKMRLVCYSWNNETIRHEHNIYNTETTIHTDKKTWRPPYTYATPIVGLRVHCIEIILTELLSAIDDCPTLSFISCRLQ